MNEPVAWIRQSKYGKPIIVQNPCYQFSYEAECAKWDDVPLYTHPAKTLTDEEIIKEALDIGFLTNEDLTPEWAEYTQEFIASVRAILRKAQER